MCVLLLPTGTRLSISKGSCHYTTPTHSLTHSALHAFVEDTLLERSNSLQPCEYMHPSCIHPPYSTHCFLSLCSRRYGMASYILHSLPCHFLLFFTSLFSSYPVPDCFHGLLGCLPFVGLSARQIRFSLRGAFRTHDNLHHSTLNETRR